MGKKSLSSKMAVLSASLMALFFGFPGMVAAQQASIANTGPDSYNKVEISNEQNCDVTNNNDINVVNENNQNAQSGDASVGGDWNNYNPESWKAKGYSYQQWQSAFNSYMSKNQGEWQRDWQSQGGGNTTAGNATSGDASNVSNTSTNVGIDNSGACGAKNNPNMPGSGSEKPSAGHVLGSSSAVPKAGSGNSNGTVLGVNIDGSGSFWSVTGSGGSNNSPMGPNGSVHNPSNSGNGGGSGGGDSAWIQNTGPDSDNKVIIKNTSNTNVMNNNSLNTVNTSNQNSTSGNANVSHNTTAGAAGTGGAGNTNATSTTMAVHN